MQPLVDAVVCMLLTAFQLPMTNALIARVITIILIYNRHWDSFSQSVSVGRLTLHNRVLERHPTKKCSSESVATSNSFLCSFLSTEGDKCIPSVLTRQWIHHKTQIPNGTSLFKKGHQFILV